MHAYIHIHSIHAHMYAYLYMLTHCKGITEPHAAITNPQSPCTHCIMHTHTHSLYKHTHRHYNTIYTHTALNHILTVIPWP